MMPRLAMAMLVASTLMAGSPAIAQPHPQHGGMTRDPGAAAPQAEGSGHYGALTNRRIKALDESRAADLLAGRGMGLALAAEMNGYPGPMHVLEHADALGLTQEQRNRALSLRNVMSAEARAIGSRIVAQEEELDALFARGEADSGRLAALTAALGGLNGRLREVHLSAHIAMRDALSEQQRAAYARLRGYQQH